MKNEIPITTAFRTDGITVTGDGCVDIVAQSGYEDITVSLDIEELEDILAQAKAHKAEYDSWVANDYKDIVVPEVGDKAKPSWGRNAGKWGTIASVQGDKVFINFGGNVLTTDGDAYPDEYWSDIDLCEFKGKTT